MAGVGFDEELLEIGDRLGKISHEAEQTEVAAPLEQLEQAATRVGRAWSGSYLGYHSRGYYKDLEPPPPGANFSAEWGIRDNWPVRGTTGDWMEFEARHVEATIRKIAGEPDIGAAQALSTGAMREFERSKGNILSILTTVLAERPDEFLNSLKEQTQRLEVQDQEEIQRRFFPTGQLMSRDSLAVSQGFKIPPHISILAEVLALREGPAACGKLARIATESGSHLARRRSSLSEGTQRKGRK